MSWLLLRLVIAMHGLNMKQETNVSLKRSRLTTNYTSSHTRMEIFTYTQSKTLSSKQLNSIKSLN